MTTGAVLITGSSSGVGHAAATHLAARGFHVYAGVRDKAASERLQAADPTITPVRLDVRDLGQIEAALQLIDEDHDGRLRGVVNNAGMANMCPLEIESDELLCTMVETNLLGPIRLIQRSLPLLRRGQGRIVNIGSMVSTVGVPNSAFYGACKAGLRAMSHTLRLELRPWDIPVIVVEPGMVKTEIAGKALRSLAESKSRVPDDLAPYRAMLDDQLLRRFMLLASSTRGSVRAIEMALTARRPRGHYYVGVDAKLAGAVRWLLPSGWIDQAVASAFRIPEPARTSTTARSGDVSNLTQSAVAPSGQRVGGG